MESTTKSGKMVVCSNADILLCDVPCPDFDCADPEVVGYPPYYDGCTCVVIDLQRRNDKKCICTDFLNNNPDPIPNPDCPIHGIIKERGNNETD